MEWSKALVPADSAHYEGVEIKNFTTSFQDGRAFLAILNANDPTRHAYDPSDDAHENLEKVRCCNAVLPICCSISIARTKRMRARDAHIGVSAC